MASTSVRVAKKSSSVSPGKPTMKSEENAMSGRAARIGHDAERAELVASLLHGHERRDAAMTDRVVARSFERIEFAFGGELGVDQLALARRPIEQGRQTVIVLRAHHEVDRGRPAQNLLALRLR